jgi:hypothetical protein
VISNSTFTVAAIVIEARPSCPGWSTLTCTSTNRGAPSLGRRDGIALTVETCPHYLPSPPRRCRRGRPTAETENGCRGAADGRLLRRRS